MTRRKQSTSMPIKRCLFCGITAPLTKEHILPDWLRKLGFMGNGAHEIFDGDADPERYVIQRGPFTRTLKIVCGPRCNYGWMKKLEDEAKPILLELFNPRAQVPLDEPKQTILSRWAFKTVAVSSQLSPRNRSLFPTAHCRELYREGRPPKQSLAWVGTASVSINPLGEQLAQYWFQPRQAEVRFDTGEVRHIAAYSARLRILNVVFDILGYQSSTVTFAAEMSNDLRRALLPIWPERFPRIWYPPVVSLDVLGGIDGLASVPIVGVPSGSPSQ